MQNVPNNGQQSATKIKMTPKTKKRKQSGVASPKSQVQTFPIKISDVMKKMCLTPTSDIDPPTMTNVTPARPTPMPQNPHCNSPETLSRLSNHTNPSNSKNNPLKNKMLAEKEEYSRPAGPAQKQSPY